MLFIAAAAVFALSLLFPLACLLWPALAEAWLGAVFAPICGALSALAGNCPFPLAEPLALLLAALLIVLLFRARRAACLLLSLLFAGYALLWAPAYFLPMGHAVPAEVSAAQLTALCEALTQRLNARGAFELPDDLGAQALRAAALVETPAPISAAPKPARYPEWMRALSLAGLYAPWTGEALYDSTAPAAGQPFTAVHELMHMGGVADEGQANICAYIACRRYGGAFARSADLWALKYAMDALRLTDAAAWEACLARLSAAVRADFFALGGASPPAAANEAAEAFLRFVGIAEKVSNYSALVAWLAARIV